MKYRKKPVTVEAVEWTATIDSWNSILNMGLKNWEPGEMGSETFLISTLDGKMKVQKGDFVIKGTRGEFYPCKPEPFWDTFKPVNQP